jgi:hypothetical protein
MSVQRHIVQRLVRSLLTLCVVIVGLLIAPATASAQAEPGTCVGGKFTASPPDGHAVAPGHKITYKLEIIVQGDTPVLGCARDIYLSNYLEFVSVRPAGHYFPETSVGPMVDVQFTGPFEPGTRLVGRVVMRVKADAPAGAVIEASSGSVIRHVVKPSH